MNDLELRIGPVRVFLERQEVQYDDGTACLTPRAEKLLLLLCMRRNTLVTRGDILSNVWAGSVVEDGAVTHCIWEIRRMLGEENRSIIETRPKRGYILHAAEPEPSPRTTDTPCLEGVSEPTDDRKSTAGHLSSDHSRILEPDPNPTNATWRSAFGILRYLSPILLLALVVVGYIKTAPSGQRISLPQGGEISAHFSFSNGYEWARKSLVTAAVEAAYDRRSTLVVFDRMQADSTFDTPHLEVRIAPTMSGLATVEMTLRQGDVFIDSTESLRPEQFTGALTRFLGTHLPDASRPISSDREAMIDALFYESQFDELGAIAQFRRALANSPNSEDAMFGIASNLDQLGQDREAAALYEKILSNPRITPSLACRIETALIRIDPALARETSCDYSRALMSYQAGDFAALLKIADRTSAERTDMNSWRNAELDAIESLVVQGDLAAAEARTLRNIRVSEQTGWSHAIASFVQARALIEAYRGQLLKAEASHMESAEAYERAGDRNQAILQRILSLRPRRPEPGVEVARQRKIARALIQRSRDSGSIENEIEAIQILLSLDRDRIDDWNKSYSRMQDLVDRHAGAVARKQNRLFLLDEVRNMRRYGQVVDAIARDLEEQPDSDTNITLWRLLLLAESEFARGRLTQAMAAVDRMEKEKFEIANTGSACLFAWLFVEGGQPARARLLLKGCDDGTQDRYARAARGDYGLMAKAAIHRMEGAPQDAWQLLAPRIEALSSTENLNRREAESLALLARHASDLPGADQASLQRALDIVTDVSSREGAGPGVRFGEHMLRWRLCSRMRGPNGCGPVLPAWAPEDHFEAERALRGSRRLAGMHPKRTGQGGMLGKVSQNLHGD